MSVVTILGVHEVTLCKDAKGKCGVSLHPVNKGVFVCFIQKDSPAALSGLRFGDQILSVSHFCLVPGACCGLFSCEQGNCKCVDY